ncbi:zinc-binding alcohol dehydrogenase family protein [Streptomyces sp. NPDC050560]|uniref:zinc-binding alcohol dehydrogenase family protein n=1 Tax=Streptomyces sp. NPDC050560 TaxID=3365630 RepID=UPI003791A4C3
MRRVRYDHQGGPLFTEEVPAPAPGPGELLVRAEAVGVTLPVVRKVREAAEPVPLGGEVAGEVVALGAGVGGFAVGDRVTGLCFGHGYAEVVPLLAPMAGPIPRGASAVDAVALVRSGLVALGVLDAAGARRGERALVTAAAGGVGHLAVQLARVRGASRVVAAVSDPAKAALPLALGADSAVAYADASWGEPVDYALDAVGGDLLGRVVGAVAPGGRLVAYSSGGGSISAYDLLAGAKTAIGFQMARIAREQPAWYERRRRELWELFAAGTVRPAVHATVPLDEAARAHEWIETRSNRGKVVLVI